MLRWKALNSYLNFGKCHSFYEKPPCCRKLSSLAQTSQPFMLLLWASVTIPTLKFQLIIKHPQPAASMLSSTQISVGSSETINDILSWESLIFSGTFRGCTRGKAPIQTCTNTIYAQANPGMSTWSQLIPSRTNPTQPISVVMLSANPSHGLPSCCPS